FGGQSVNVIEIIVAGGYSKVVLLRGCGNPDVILRNWSTLFAKKMFDFSVMLTRAMHASIMHMHNDASRSLFHSHDLLSLAPVPANNCSLKNSGRPIRVRRPVKTQSVNS